MVLVITNAAVASSMDTTGNGMISIIELVLVWIVPVVEKVTSKAGGWHDCMAMKTVPGPIERARSQIRLMTSPSKRGKRQSRQAIGYERQQACCCYSWAGREQVSYSTSVILPSMLAFVCSPFRFMLPPNSSVPFFTQSSPVNNISHSA